MKQYSIPAKSIVCEHEIKKSRFITHIAHTPGIEAAKDFVAKIKVEHASATHNCWAFVAGAPNDSMQLGFSDDGEPSGTAGKPMLAQLQGSGVGEICAVVTRYSGGIKLGTGGLVKAYGGGVSQGLAQLTLTTKVITKQVTIKMGYDSLAMVEHTINQFEGQNFSCEFAENITATCNIALDKVNAFADVLLNASKGQITCHYEQ